MDVKRQVKWMSGAALSILFAVAMPVQAETNKKKPVVVAGPIGKSSSASARITLVIPPRPDKAKQQTVAQPTQQTSKQGSSEKPEQK